MSTEKAERATLEGRFILEEVMHCLECRASDSEYKSEAWWAFQDAMQIIIEANSAIVEEQRIIWEECKKAGHDPAPVAPTVCPLCEKEVSSEGFRVINKDETWHVHCFDQGFPRDGDSESLSKRFTFGSWVVEIDQMAQAAYVYLNGVIPDGGVDHTASVGNINLDYDSDGKLLGVEIIRG